MIDTYWSDHCRHTTFLTTVDDAKIEDKEIENTYRAYLAAREALAKPERKLVLRIIDAQNLIIEQTSLDSFIAGFELAWRLSIELQNEENERSFSCRTRRTGARCVWEDEI